MSQFVSLKNFSLFSFRVNEKNENGLKNRDLCGRKSPRYPLLRFIETKVPCDEFSINRSEERKKKMMTFLMVSKYGWNILLKILADWWFWWKKKGWIVEFLRMVDQLLDFVDRGFEPAGSGCRSGAVQRASLNSCDRSRWQHNGKFVFQSRFRKFDLRR